MLSIPELVKTTSAEVEYDLKCLKQRNDEANILATNNKDEWESNLYHEKWWAMRKVPSTKSISDMKVHTPKAFLTEVNL